MARQRKTAVTSQAREQDATTKAWAALTWEDVDRWAGSRSASRGRAYQRRGRVKDLALDENGHLLATVVGTDRYVTSVWLAPAKGRARTIKSTCTCPVGSSGCKHAVAVVVAFLEALADKQAIPGASSDDPRWRKLSKPDGNPEDEFGEEPDESDDEFGEGLDSESDDELERGAGDSDKTDEHPLRLHPVPTPAKAARGIVSRRSRAEWNEKIRTHIGQKSQAELASLVWALVERFPELRSELQERIALAEGDVDRLVNQARRDLLAVTGEIGWSNHWNDEGNTPDYTRLKHKLERLVEGRHYDQVVNLGNELIRRGIRQIEQSHDEGETATEIAACLPVVFDALTRSSRAAPEKILYAIDACLQDEYDVIGQAADAILTAEWQAADWSVVADRLAERLKSMPRGKTPDDFTRNYKRDRVSHWLLLALERADRKDELLAVYEAEARATGSYQRLVEYLLAQGRLDDAERWAREGIASTRAKWPGIASALLKTLCELARRRKAWDVVAAHVAGDFFERPSVQGFRELVAAADKTRCQEAVRAAALEFLESGRSPIGASAGRSGQREMRTDPAWPLPVPDYLAREVESGDDAGSTSSTRSAHQRQSTPRPHYDVLLEMAIAEKRPNDVLHWYDKMLASEKRPFGGGWGYWGGYGSTSYSDRVAAAVASSHPERTLDIYRRGLDANLTRADISAYESCAGYLRKLRPILKSLGRGAEWTRLLADIRQDYSNRPRFMEILDTLEGRTILQTRKARRNR